jgi:hypothetical protein
MSEEQPPKIEGEHRVESSSLSSAAVVPDATNPNHVNTEPVPDPVPADPGDDNGEVLVEAAEDTVIY